MSDEKKGKSQDHKVIPSRRDTGDFSKSKKELVEHIEKMEAPVKWPDPPNPDSSSEE